MLTHYQNTRTLMITSAILGGGFLFGALAHVVGWLPFGSLANESQIIPTALVEVFCGLALLYAAAVLRTPDPESYPRSFIAHVGAIMAVIVGMFSFTLGVGKSTELNTAFHAVMLVLLVLNTIGLWRLRPRNPVKQIEQHHIAARMY